MRMQEAQRMQEADILGKTFTFQGQEQRDVADISRASSARYNKLDSGHKILKPLIKL